MVNQLVNEFYTQFLFKIGALSKDVASPLDVDSNLFNNLSPDVRYLLISEGVQIPPRPPTETNHQGNQRLILVRNAAVESEKKTRTIKMGVEPDIGSRHIRTFMGMLGGNPSIKMAGLGGRFQFKEKNSMVTELLKYNALASAEAYYEYPGEQVIMG